MLRAIQEIKPKYVIAENVFGITNIDGGLVFEQVCLDLEAEGYEVQPFIIPAAAKNAPHRRDRCWFIAENTMFSGRLYRESEQERTEVWQQRNTCTRSSERIHLSEGDATDIDSNGLNKCNSNDEINTSEGGKYALSNFEQIHNEQPIIEHTNVQRQKRRLYEKQSKTTIREQFSERNARSTKSTNWHNFPTQSPICGGDDGLPTKLDGITFSKWRAESIKGYGNAIVPQVALELFKIIETI
jgi:DNA (cytosine-5)-methyltransferase 1